MQGSEANSLDDDTPILEKDMGRKERMARSEHARGRRRSVKNVIETRIANAWAKARRARKNK
jgi:hypothetical protein